MREANCRWWKHQLGFTGSFMVDCRGRSGGLALFWHEFAAVTIKSYSNGNIDCIVHESEQVWRFTGFYGHPEANMRHFSWELLQRHKDIAEVRDLPWIVGGDFNEICYDSEKLGGNRRVARQMQSFREALEICELQDLHGTGEFYTWVNRRESNNIIFERLDRFVANLKWRTLFPVARARSLEFYHSDHRPISMNLHESRTQSRAGNGNKVLPFRFEKGWLMEDDCREVVEQGWGNRDINVSILERIDSCKKALTSWDTGKLRRVPKQLKARRAKLNQLRTSAQWSENVIQIKSLESEVENLATKEEMYWRQRSRISWLKDGDRNTKYFHSRASCRRNQNSLTGLISSHGDWCTDNDGRSTIVLDYFDSLFTTSSPSEDDIVRVLDEVEPKIDNRMNQILNAPFTADEVRRALFDMHPDKAPGPDGLSALFYQKFLDVVGKDVTDEILRVLNEGAPLEAWNATLVTLIPKTKNPMLMKEFRPISLCNVYYKIVLRSLTNRLRPVLSKIIEESQSVFIPGRLITDNIIWDLKFYIG